MSSPANAKIEVCYSEPPALNMNFRTTAIPFESLKQSLHLPSFPPRFKILKSRTSYSGIPLDLFAKFTNCRFQPIRDVSISIKAKIGNREIYKQQAEMGTQVDPQKWITYPFSFSSAIPGTLNITLTANFRIENQKSIVAHTESFTILTSLAISYKTRSYPTMALQATIENKMPRLMTNINARTSVKDELHIVDELEPGDKASIFIPLHKPINALEVSWSLSNTPTCTQTIALKETTETKLTPISVKIDIPNTVATLQPFQMKAILHNNTKETLTGTLEMVPKENAVYPVGSNDLKFFDFEPGTDKELVINMIAIAQGAFSVPPIQINCEGKKSFTADAYAGTYVIGNVDD